MGAPTYCSRCGSPQPAGSAFCPRCGAPAAPGPQYFAGPTYRTPPRKRSNFPAWAIVLIILIVAIAAIAAIALIEAGVFIGSLSKIDAVQVTAIDMTSTDDVCGLNGHSLSAGLYSSPDASFQDTLTIPSFNSTSCTIISVTAVTAGFGISGADVPLTIPAEGSQSLSFTVTTPSSFDGVLTIDFE